MLPKIKQIPLFYDPQTQLGFQPRSLASRESEPVLDCGTTRQGGSKYRRQGNARGSHKSSQQLFLVFGLKVGRDAIYNLLLTVGRYVSKSMYWQWSKASSTCEHNHQSSFCQSCTLQLGPDLEFEVTSLALTRRGLLILVLQFVKLLHPLRSVALFQGNSTVKVGFQLGRHITVHQFPFLSDAQAMGRCSLLSSRKLAYMPFHFSVSYNISFVEPTKSAFAWCFRRFGEQFTFQCPVSRRFNRSGCGCFGPINHVILISATVVTQFYFISDTAGVVAIAAVIQASFPSLQTLLQSLWTFGSYDAIEASLGLFSMMSPS